MRDHILRNALCFRENGNQALLAASPLTRTHPGAEPVLESIQRHRSAANCLQNLTSGDSLTAAEQLAIRGIPVRQGEKHGFGES